MLIYSNLARFAFVYMKELNSINLIRDYCLLEKSNNFNNFIVELINKSIHIFVKNRKRHTHIHMYIYFIVQIKDRRKSEILLIIDLLKYFATLFCASANRINTSAFQFLETFILYLLSMLQFAK